MDNKILELASKIKNSAEGLLSNHYYEDIPVSPSDLIKLCSEIERINKLLPLLPENIKCPTAPELVWLQSDPEPEEEGEPVYPINLYGCEVTWCTDRINPTDTLYIRADLISGK